MKRIAAIILLTASTAHADSEAVPAGSIDICLPIAVKDSSSSTGAMLTGLAYNTASLDCDYYREGSGASVSITLATSTLGTHTDGAFKEINSTELPGQYEFCPPDAAFAVGADWVTFSCSGAANMVPVNLKVPLTPFDGLIASESGTTIGLASGAVDADDQFNSGFALVVFDSAGLISAKSCITDSVNTGDTVTTSENITALIAVNDRYILQPEAGCLSSGVTAGSIADAVWDEAVSGHRTPATFGGDVLKIKR